MIVPLLLESRFTRPFPYSLLHQLISFTYFRLVRKPLFVSGRTNSATHQQDSKMDTFPQELIDRVSIFLDCDNIKETLIISRISILS
jgi:hypothetical protein